MKKKRKVNYWAYTRLILICAAFVLLFLFLVKLISESKWDGNSRFTLIADGEPLIFYSVEPAASHATVLFIPANTILEVPFGYDSYPAKSVFLLGNLDQKRGGGVILTKAVENTFGVVTDGYIAKQTEDKFLFPKDQTELLKFKKKYFTLSSVFPGFYKIPAFLNNLSTNISALDFIKLWLATRSLRSDQITVLDLSQSAILQEENLPDGTKAQIFDKDLFDELENFTFQDQKIRLQNISVEVVNATDKEKEAAKFARIISHLGGNVVSKTTAVSGEDINCKIEVFQKELLSSIIVTKIADVYKCSKTKVNESGVADIKIVLGREFIK